MDLITEMIWCQEKCFIHDSVTLFRYSESKLLIRVCLWLVKFKTRRKKWVAAIFALQMQNRSRESWLLRLNLHSGKSLKLTRILHVAWLLRQWMNSSTVKKSPNKFESYIFQCKNKFRVSNTDIRFIPLHSGWQKRIPKEIIFHF